MFRVYIYLPPREHDPSHVHVECTEGGEVIVTLGDAQTAPSLRHNHHMKAGSAREALRLVTEHQGRFLDDWRRLHG